jgi:hypothetical protein
MASTSTNRRQGINTGAAVKVPCKAATTANITLSGAQTIDGVSCVADDRVLVKEQTTASENGIYDVSSSTWQRAKDFDGSFDVVQGTLVPVANGTTYEGQVFRVTTANPITIGTTSLAFEFALTAETLSFLQSGSGAVSRTVAAKGQEYPTLFDYIPTAMHAAITAKTSTEDASSYIQAAIDSLGTEGGIIDCNYGKYYVPTAVSSAKRSVHLRALGASAYSTGGSVDFYTDSTDIILDIGSASATTHAGWTLDNINFTDSGGTAAGALRIRRMNHVRLLNVSANAFTAGYCVLFDGTGDACIVPLILAPKFRNSKFGVQTASLVAAMSIVGGYMTGNSIASSIGVDFAGTGDVRVLGTALDAFITGCKLQGSQCYVAARFEGNTTGVHVAAGNRNQVQGSTFTNGTTGILIDGTAAGTMYGPNSYAGDVTTPVDDQTAAGSASHCFEPESTLGVRISKSITGGYVHEIGNLRQSNGDYAEYRTEANRGAIIGKIKALLDATSTVDVGAESNHNVRLLQNNAEVGRLTSAGISGKLGGTTTMSAVPVVASVSGSTAGNTTTGEDDLLSYAVPANTLSANLTGIEVEAWGSTANNANAKTIKFYFGSAAIGSMALTVSQASPWYVKAQIIRTASNTQRGIVTYSQGGTTKQADVAIDVSLTQTDTNAITVKMTGEGVDTNDILQRGMTVKFIR